MYKPRSMDCVCNTFPLLNISGDVWMVEIGTDRKMVRHFSVAHDNQILYVAPYSTRALKVNTRAAAPQTDHRTHRTYTPTHTVTHKHTEVKLFFCCFGFLRLLPSVTQTEKKAAAQTFSDLLSLRLHHLSSINVTFYKAAMDNG